jgi:hypothetical protein
MSRAAIPVTAAGRVPLRIQTTFRGTSIAATLVKSQLRRLCHGEDGQNL